VKRFLKWLIIGVFLSIVGAGVIFWTPDTDVATMRAKYGSAASQYVDLGEGLTVHLRDEGPRNAPVIMLLHGSNSFLQTWDAWTAILSSSYRVIRLDLPGHGMTGAYPARAYSKAAFVEVVDRAVKKLGIERFILGGNSMGGGVSWAYAHKYPEKLAGLVLIDASGQPEPEPQDLPIGFRIAQTPVLRDVMLYITPRSIIEQGLRQSVTNQSVVTLQTLTAIGNCSAIRATVKQQSTAFRSRARPFLSAHQRAPSRRSSSGALTINSSRHHRRHGSSNRCLMPRSSFIPLWDI
jgi:pimeloyl-ACP methyl ester carboxylesterase